MTGCSSTPVMIISSKMRRVGKAAFGELREPASVDVHEEDLVPRGNWPLDANEREPVPVRTKRDAPAIFRGQQQLFSAPIRSRDIESGCSQSIRDISEKGN